MRRRLPAVLLGVAAAAISAAPALAKERVMATLTSSVPVDAASGQEITIAWRLESVDDEGRRRPFDASGVFVQLESRTGGLPSVGLASAENSRNGDFDAIVIVPDGGIGGIAIGLGGTVSDAAGTRPSALYFPVTNNPLPAVTDPSSLAATAATPTPAGPVDGPGGSGASWIAALVLAGIVVAGAAVAVLRRNRHAAASD